MGKQKKFIMLENSDDVVSIWRCPECQKTFTMFFGDFAEIGTPVCDTCDIDCKFDHAEINEEILHECFWKLSPMLMGLM